MSLIARTKSALCLITAGAFLMLLVAQMTGHTEIVLPTFGALMTGGWLFQDNLWHYRRLNLIISMALASVIGLSLSILSQYIGGWFIFVGFYIGFLLTAGILVVGRTQIYPCFGAFALPLIFQTTSWLYPLSVAVLASMMIFVQWILEKCSLRQPLGNGEFPNLPEHRFERMRYYLRVSMGLVPILILIPLMQYLGDIHVHLLLQAPLFVTYTTFCNQHSTFIHHPKQTCVQIVMAATIGIAFCWLSSYVSAFTGDALAVALCTGGAVGCTLILSGYLFVKRFPPAISMAITPFLAVNLMTHIHQLLLFPIFVAAAASYCIFVAWIFRRHPTYESMDLNYL